MNFSNFLFTKRGKSLDVRETSISGEGGVASIFGQQHMCRITCTVRAKRQKSRCEHCVIKKLCLFVNVKTLTSTNEMFDLYNPINKNADQHCVAPHLSLLILCIIFKCLN